MLFKLLSIIVKIISKLVLSVLFLITEFVAFGCEIVMRFAILFAGFIKFMAFVVLALYWYEGVLLESFNLMFVILTFVLGLGSDVLFKGLYVLVMYIRETVKNSLFGDGFAELI